MCFVQMSSPHAAIHRPLKSRRGSGSSGQRSYLSICSSIPATSGSKNKMNVACTAVVDDRFDKLHFFNKVWTQIPSHNGKERSIHGLQDTTAVIHDR
jgi:hypothetical protein